MDKLVAEIKVLEAKQASFLANLTGTMDYAQKIKQADKATLMRFKVKLDSAELVKSSFIETVERLNILQAEADSTHVVDFKAVDQCLEVFCAIKCAYEELHILVNSASNTTPGTSQSTAATVPKLKLPELNLPMFTGQNMAEWVVFHELFKTLIHERTDLTDTQKCQYLVSRLAGKALVCCSSLPATPENYLVIWQSLVDRYNDPRVLCSQYLDTILQFKPAKSETQDTLNQFVESFGAAVAALKALRLTDLADAMLVHLASGKLCPDTVKLFERTLKKNEIPTFDKLLEFVKEQARILSRVQPGNNWNSTVVPLPGSKVQPPKPRLSHNFLITDSTDPPPSENCYLCKKSAHLLFRCEKFHSLSPRDRYDVVRTAGRCLNCLSSNHGVKNCPSQKSCSKCDKRHHSLLHFPVVKIDPPPSEQLQRGSSQKSSSTCNVSTRSLVGRSSNEENSSFKTVLLATVQVLIESPNGEKHLVRFLLDGGSQSNFITHKLCEQLNLGFKGPGSTVVSGLGSSFKPFLGETRFRIDSKIDSSLSYQLDALVVDTITDRLPSSTVKMDAEALSHLKHLALADDNFGTPGEIQGLLGASLYPYLIIPGQVSGVGKSPIALNTTLGYVIVGEVPVFDAGPSSFCGFVQTQNLENMVKQFFEHEDVVVENSIVSKDDMEAETHFQETSCFVSDESRYMVRIPFKESPKDSLGSSSPVAYSRFMALERRLEKSPELRVNYNQAIQDLLEANHLELCNEENDAGYFVPHREVVKENSLSTKFRIVYDFSCPSDNGKSLNDIVYSGPKLYNDLFEILLKFRLFPVALVADITKMFLQILVHPEDRQYQKIFWRFSPKEPVQVYQLNRVTFGLTSSPFLSQRVLRQLVLDLEKEFPLAKSIVFDSFYMDDLTASLPDSVLALNLYNQLVACFKRASFDLVKWASNDPEFLSHLPEEVCVWSPYSVGTPASP